MSTTMRANTATSTPMRVKTASLDQGGAGEDVVSSCDVEVGAAWLARILVQSTRSNCLMNIVADAKLELGTWLVGQVRNKWALAGLEVFV